MKPENWGLLPGGGFSFRVLWNAGWLLFLLQVGWFFWRLPYCVNPLTCMREEIGLMWVLAISCIYGGEFPTKIIIQTIQKIFAHFFLKYKNARGGICVRTSSKSIIYIYTVYTAFLSEDFQNMFDFERKITTKVFYFEASQIYR